MLIFQAIGDMLSLNNNNNNDNNKTNKHNKINQYVGTWASVSPRVAANCLLSGFVIYFCSENLLSKPFRWSELKTALDHDLFLFVPPAAMLVVLFETCKLVIAKNYKN